MKPDIVVVTKMKHQKDPKTPLKGYSERQNRVQRVPPEAESRYEPLYGSGTGSASQPSIPYLAWNQTPTASQRVIFICAG